MDIFEKLNANLEPMGSGLYIDGFIASMQAAREARAARDAAAARRSEQEARPKPAADPRPEVPGRAGGRKPARSEDEVSAYMNRNQIEGVDADEVQEFLRERSGFIPMDDDE